MIALGILLFLLGWALNIVILYSLGLILLVIGIIFLVATMLGHPVAGRRTWY